MMEKCRVLPRISRVWARLIFGSLGFQLLAVIFLCPLLFESLSFAGCYDSF